MKKTFGAIALGVIAIGGISLAAQQSFIPPTPSFRFQEAWRPNGARGDTRMVGTVIDIRQVPVGKAKVQLRNLDTGLVEGVAESNANGEYEFQLDHSGTFVVEMVLVDGYVLALSNAGSLARYDTLQTVVMLPGRWDEARRSLVPTQVFASFFGMSATTSMTGATLSIAVNQNVGTVDAGLDISPNKLP